MKARELDVYKRAFEAAVEIQALSATWPKDEIYGGLASQARRCSRSICANIVEGLGKMGPLEQRRFLNMALGSAEETQVWLEFTVRYGWMAGPEGERLDREYEEIGRMVFGLMKRREKD